MPSEPSANGPYRDARGLPPATTPQNYVAQWVRYRRLRGLTSPLMPLLAIVLGMIVQQILGGHDFGGIVAVVFILSWWMGWAILRYQFVHFLCPRCQKRFLSYQSDDDHCAHCHLRRDAPFDPDAKNELP